MAFSSFQALSQVQEIYGIKYEADSFVVPTDLTPSDALRQRLQFTVDTLDVFSSEGARTELIISPILFELFTVYSDTLAFWVQKPMSADAVLNEIPDYIFGLKSPLGKTVLGLPLVLIVEAKKNDFEQGWGQCLAELVAAQKINGTTEKSIYGIVTDGIRWEFGKLTASTFVQDKGDYLTNEINELFGAIDFVLQSSL